MLVLRMILVTGEAGVVELELLQSQQIKIIHGKCMLRCRTILHVTFIFLKHNRVCLFFLSTMAYKKNKD